MTDASTAPSSSRLPYQPALDGIRALAVLAVMTYHAGFDGTPAGFIGVDVFLVLSGFLITMLLVDEVDRTGRIGLRDFWVRRARRLLPALVIVLVAVAIFGRFWAQPAEQVGLRGDLLGSLFYVQNWRAIFSGESYFEQFLAPSPLRHMWSLAIEEQWYLIWPLVLTGLARLTRARRRPLVAIILGLAVASAALMWLIGDRGEDVSRAYYGTDTRAQALLVGAALAVFTRGGRLSGDRLGRSPIVAVQTLGLVGLGFLGWVVVAQSEQWSLLYRGGFSLVALAAAAVIAAALVPGPLRSGLALPPLPAIGLISYGLYLWHWPVDVVLSPARTGLSGSPLFVARTAVAFVIAIASFLLVERPIRERRWTFLRRGAGWIPVGIATTTAILLVATIGMRPDPQVPSADAVAEFAAIMTKRPGPGVTRVLFQGDSIAATLAYEGFQEDWADRIWLRGNPRIGCGLLGGTPVSDGEPGADQDRCHRWEPEYRRDVRAYDPHVAVLLIGGWEAFDRDLDGRRLRVGTPEMARVLRAELDQARAVLTERGAHFVLLTTPCFSPVERELGQWGDPERADPERVRWLNQVWRGYGADHPDVTVLDLHDQVCPNGEYVDRVDGLAQRTDGVHFTDAGADRVWDWLAPALREVAAAPVDDPNRQVPTAGAP